MTCRELAFIDEIPEYNHHISSCKDFDKLSEENFNINKLKKIIPEEHKFNLLID